jgi:uncharacterized membrane protein YccC
VPVGVLAAMPATQSFGTMLGLITATLLGLQSTYAADFTSYANSNIAALVGLGTAAVMMALVRSVGAEWSARRLLRSGWKELAAIPRTRTPHERAALAALLLDRLGLLVPRLAAAGAGNELAAVDALVDLRIGVNMVDLQRDRAVLPPLVRAAVDTALSGTAAHFAEQAAERRVLQPPVALLQDIDRALDAAIGLRGRAARDLLLQLVGIRRGLFAAAPPYQPPTPPNRAMQAPASEAAA